MSLTYIKVIVSTRFNISIRISCTETALHSANARKILKKNTNKEVKTKKKYTLNRIWLRFGIMHMTNTEQHTDNMAEKRKQSKDKDKDKLNQMEVKQNERNDANWHS